MTGLSAGSLCWFETGTTDSFGPGLAALSGGLGFVPGSHAPHYDGEVNGGRSTSGSSPRARSPRAMPQRGAALVFRGTELAEVVASWPDARAYRVERGPDGAAVETELPTRYLG